MELILFTYGDSANASTWSNVPFLMSLNLEKLGHTIHRVDIAPSRFIDVLFKIFSHGIFRQKQYSFIRTPFFKWITDRKIKSAVSTHPTSDYCIFVNFDFYNRFSNIPSLLFSDWTYQMLLEDRLGCKIKERDYRFIRQQEEAIENARIVLPLFSETSDKLRVLYPQANICQIPFNVINNMSGDLSPDPEIIKSKFKSDYILFVGRRKYRKGLEKLIDAIQCINNRHIRIEVIGMERHEISCSPDFVHFNGFLHKDIPDECDRYYNLVKNAKCMVNPTSKWAAYSSIVEGMFFYNPVVVTPFEQFVKEFGRQIDFGLYIDESKDDSLKNCIDKIFSMPMPEYEQCALNAHESVKDYTWERYVAEMIDMMVSFNE